MGKFIMLGLWMVLFVITSFMIDLTQLFEGFGIIGGHAEIDQVIHALFFLIFGLTIPLFIGFWAKIKNTKKPYLIYVVVWLSFTALLTLSSTGCSGEGCMIWIFIPMILIGTIFILFLWQLIAWLMLKYFKIDSFNKLLWLLFGTLILCWALLGIEKLF